MKVGRRRVGPSRASWVWMGLLAVVVWLAGCVTAGGGGAPPVMPDVLPQKLPTGLAVPATPPDPAKPSRATLEQGEDGFLYALGLVNPGEGGAVVPPVVGGGYVLRYGGEWPDAYGARPIVGFGRAARVFVTPGGQTNALLQPE